MIKIAISQLAFDAIVATMKLGSVGYENATDQQGQRLIWLEPQVLNSLRALRWPSESYSDVIIRMAAYNAEERSVIEVVQRGRDKPLTKEEIYLSLEQARDLCEIDDSTGARHAPTERRDWAADVPLPSAASCANVGSRSRFRRRILFGMGAQ